jgi:hypothetical protein
MLFAINERDLFPAVIAQFHGVDGGIALLACRTGLVVAIC